MDNQIAVLNNISGQVETEVITRGESPSGQLKSISAVLPNVGKVTWDNPFAEYSFSDEQIAVATILQGMSNAISDGAPPIYTNNEFLTDIEIIQAFRYSADALGKNISLPLNERKERMILLARSGFWKRKLRMWRERHLTA